MTELAAIAAAAEPTDSPIALLLGAAYGVFSLLLGAALMVTGVAVIREKFWQGWKRWIPLSLGIWLYVLVLPALAWSFVGAGFAIASWMLLFAALGWVLMRDDGEPLPRRTNFQRGRRPFPMARALRHKSQ